MSFIKTLGLGYFLSGGEGVNVERTSNLIGTISLNSVLDATCLIQIRMHHQHQQSILNLMYNFDL